MGMPNDLPEKNVSNQASKRFRRGILEASAMPWLFSTEDRNFAQKAAHGSAQRRLCLIFGEKSETHVRMSRWGIICVAVLMLGFSGSVSATPATMVDGQSTTALTASLRPVARNYTPLPDMRWSHRNEADRWSRAALMALRSHASVLPRTVPKDIADWCPAYTSNDTSAREAFWVGLLSTLAKHESTFRPTAVGGGGKWYGLLQILPATARGYRCNATSRDALSRMGAQICNVRSGSWP